MLGRGNKRMPTDDPKDPTLHEKLAAGAAAAAARTSVEAMARGAADAVGKAADGALDAVERMLFGKVGAAEEAVKREQMVDPVERLRAQYGLGPREGGAIPTGNPAVKEDPVEEAKRQLAELKRKRAEPTAEVKKTL